jgi:hypothetical protein
MKLMKQIVLFLIGLTVLLTAGCDVVERRVFRSHITYYYDCPEFILETSESGNIALRGSGENGLCGWSSKGREKAIYDSLCVLHHDMSYNKKRDYIVGPGWGASYKGDIVSIDVVSNADFDAQHPAGAPLNDIVRIISVSPYPYITSGYKKTYDWKRNPPENLQRENIFRGRSNRGENPFYYPIDKRLSELTSSDLILADMSEIFLIFEKQPDLSKEHNLTVTIKVSDGKVSRPTITKVFE